MPTIIFKYRLRVQKLTTQEYILGVLFLGTIAYSKSIDQSEFLVVPVFIGAHLIPVSTFGNNLSNIPFLAIWISGIVTMSFVYDNAFYLGPLSTLVLYFLAKFIFLSITKRDLVLGSSSARLLSNKWYSGISKSDGSRGDSRDMRFQSGMAIIAIAELYLIARV